MVRTIRQAKNQILEYLSIQMKEFKVNSVQELLTKYYRAQHPEVRECTIIKLRSGNISV